MRLFDRFIDRDRKAEIITRDNELSHEGKSREMSRPSLVRVRIFPRHVTVLLVNAKSHEPSAATSRTGRR